MIREISDYMAVVQLAKDRGMKVSKAASRLGHHSVRCKAYSAAHQIAFLEGEDMIEAARTIANSCMSSNPEGYAYWADTGQMAVATLKESRCLVRVDNRTFAQAYGVQSGELIAGLKILGFIRDKEQFNEGLKTPPILYRKGRRFMPKPTGQEVIVGIIYGKEALGRHTRKGEPRRFFYVGLCKDIERPLRKMIALKTECMPCRKEGEWFHIPTGKTLRHCRIKQETTIKPFRVRQGEPIGRPWNDGVGGYL